MEWISVKTRLPEDGQKVICFGYNDIEILKFIQTTDGRHKKRSGYFEWDNSFLDVTHWMPLPKDPEE